MSMQSAGVVASVSLLVTVQEFVLGLAKCMRGALSTKLQLIFRAVASVHGSSGSGKAQKVRPLAATAPCCVSHVTQCLPRCACAGGVASVPASCT